MPMCGNQKEHNKGRLTRLHFCQQTVFQTHKSIQLLTLPLAIIYNCKTALLGYFFKVSSQSFRRYLQSDECIFCLDPEAGVNGPLVVSHLVRCCPGFCQGVTLPACFEPVTPPQNKTQAFWPMSSCYPKGGKKACSFL